MLKRVIKTENLLRSFCASTSFAFLILVGAETVSGQFEIRDLKDPDVVTGCSCSIQRPVEAKNQRSNKFLFISETGADDAWMNINGKDTKLTLVKTTVNDSGKYGVGRRFYEEYTANKIKIRIDYVTTWVCPSEDEACEHAKYDTTITVTKGKSSKTVKAIGICAC